MNTLTFQCRVQFKRQDRGRKELCVAVDQPDVPVGRIPRVSRMMALALRFDDLIARGEVADYADLARLGHVTRARVTQVMNMLNLAPDIQEAILYLPPTTSGRDPITEYMMRPIAAEADWGVQRGMWRKLREVSSDA